MKKFLAMGLVAAGLMMGACQGPIPAFQDPNAPLQVSLASYGLQDKIRVTVMPVERFGAGQLRVRVEGFNRTNQDLGLEYSFWFTDKTGRQVEQPRPGYELIRPNDYKTVTFESLTAADDFRVQLRQSR
jgi:hypothetical protein